MQKCIPKIYCFINSFNKDYIKSLNKNIAIIYRNYEDKINPSLILDIKNFCKKNNRKFYLSNNIKLSLKLDLDGVYLPSFKNEKKKKKLKKKKKILSFRISTQYKRN